MNLPAYVLAACEPDRLTAKAWKKKDVSTFMAHIGWAVAGTHAPIQRMLTGSNDAPVSPRGALTHRQHRSVLVGSSLGSGEEPASVELHRWLIRLGVDDISSTRDGSAHDDVVLDTHTSDTEEIAIAI